jgi:predicted NUDIX family NTP pyrophosphohydrolase
MRNRKRSIARWTAVLALTAGLVAAVYALTAANTVPDTKAGDGTGTVTGYTVSNVHYVLNSDVSKIDSVTFDVDSAPASGATMKIQLVSGGSWYTCTNVATAITCDTTSPQATVLATNQLRVVIVN